MEPFLSAGRLVAGVAFDIPGMGYKDPSTGEVGGFEADVARLIGEKLVGSSKNVDFVQVQNETRFPVLQNDKADVVLSQITITPDRAEQVDFSIPYYTTREAIIVRKGSRIKTYDDLEKARIAVTAGSISIRRMRANRPDATLVVKDLNAGSLEAVANGEADAASNDAINLLLLRKYCAQPDQFEIFDIGDHFEDKPYGVAVKKGNTALVELLNSRIEELTKNGEIDRVLQMYVT